MSSSRDWLQLSVRSFGEIESQLGSRQPREHRRSEAELVRAGPHLLVDEIDGHASRLERSDDLVISRIPALPGTEVRNPHVSRSSG